jgi:hypothetical protein
VPIIHKDGGKNKMRFKTTKITFINLNIMEEFLLWRGNRSLNPRVFLAQFGHHRSMGRKQIVGGASQLNTTESIFNPLTPNDL